MTHEDEKQLRLLSQLHFVGAVLAGAIPLGGLLYCAMGIAIVLGKFPGSPPTHGEPFGWVAVGIGMFVCLLGAVAVGLNLVTARSLRDRKRHTLCLLTSGLNCMHVPLGTLLGVFTIVVLCRPAVSAAFRSAGPPSADPGPFAASGPPVPPASSPNAGSIGARG
jgi:hypothetical protein